LQKFRVLVEKIRKKFGKIPQNITQKIPHFRIRVLGSARRIRKKGMVLETNPFFHRNINHLSSSQNSLNENKAANLKIRSNLQYYHYFPIHLYKLKIERKKIEIFRPSFGHSRI
jgi:hypothetical protein